MQTTRKEAKKIGGGEVPVITKCFYITKSFQEKLRCGKFTS